MAETRGKPSWIGRLFGLVLVMAAVYAVFFVEWGTTTHETPPPIRPLKTLVIESPFASMSRKLPGKVKANREVDLAFQVAGPLVELRVRSGLEVAEGELLAKIDPRDFKTALDSAEAKLTETEVLWTRMELLYKDGVAQLVEYEQKKREHSVALANAEQARKNLEDTNLRAPFAGVIANTFVENFENVQAKQQILSLQDVTSIEIEVNIPEEGVALRLKNINKPRLIATFEYLPGREFEVTPKEFAMEADPLTQTYAATVSMPAPEDVSILPGMTATISVHWPQDTGADDSAYAVPIEAVPIDGLGRYYVWIVTQDKSNTWVVHRVDVSVGEMMQDKLLVTAGLTKGDRIAVAGVHSLQEGQRVRLLGVKSGDDS